MHVIHTFANNSTVPYLSWFAARAAKEGQPRYSFLIMYREKPAMMEEMKQLGFRCIWIKYNEEHRKRGMLKALPLLWWHMMKLRPDIVHGNLFDDTAPALLAARFAGIRIRIITRQDTGFHWIHAPRWVWLDRWNTWMATQVIAISNECRQHLLDHERAPAGKISLVHNGIPTESSTDRSDHSVMRLKRRFGIQDRAPIIGTVARFIQWKGHRHILDAASILISKYPNAVFLFCGQGGMENELRRAVAETGLQGHVIFTGWIDRQDMPSFYGLLDIYLHAAALEPFGLVYAEAMMNGVPVVSTATGAAKDAITDGVNGILATERSGTALAAGLERLLQMDFKAIGQAGRKTALEMFTFERMWNGTMDVYRKALEPAR
jgi:glycosyltransferase involved in cell wall biosynthesis